MSTAGATMSGRLWKLSVGTLLLPILAAPHAMAKGGPESQPVAVISISGPGLDGPILMNGDPVWRVLYLTTFRGYGLPYAEAPSAERLGPALEARYRFVLPNGDVRSLRQSLFPCAADGRLWAHTPPGQDRVRLRIGSEVQTGWWHSRALPDVLGRAAVEEVCGEVEGDLAGGGGSAAGSLTLLWVGLASVLILTVAGALGRSSLRRRHPMRA
jgi:hypothetical protein